MCHNLQFGNLPLRGSKIITLCLNEKAESYIFLLLISFYFRGRQFLCWCCWKLGKIDYLSIKKMHFIATLLCFYRRELQIFRWKMLFFMNSPLDKSCMRGYNTSPATIKSPRRSGTFKLSGKTSQLILSSIHPFV